MTEQIKKVPAEAGITEPAPLENPVLISDLHLTTKKPATIMGFFRFMKDVAPHYSELVILGDLFDFWIGDDAMAAAEPIIAQLKLYSSLGHRLLIMPGNRDVMLGEDFARACGAELLAPQVKVNIKGRDVLLSHGDEWCLRDKEYQAFRAMVRNPQWQRMALSYQNAASPIRPVFLISDAMAESTPERGSPSARDRKRAASAPSGSPFLSRQTASAEQASMRLTYHPSGSRAADSSVLSASSVSPAPKSSLPK